MTGDLLEPGWSEYFVSANGVRLHVVEAGLALGPPLILLHGFPEFWWAWRKQIGPLAAAGFRVIVPDLRGYNRSEVPRGVASFTLDILADDIAAVADVLQIPYFDLVAHDWGGVVAWWVAARHPERVARLVVMDAPHPDTLRKVIQRHPTQALRSLYALAFQVPRLPEALLTAGNFALLRALMVRTARPDAFEPGAIDRYVEAWSRPGTLTAMLNYYRALRLRRDARPPARIAAPTLVLWGEHDGALGRPVAEAAVAQCKRGELEIIPGTSHWLHLEEPEQVTEAILRHLTG